MTGYGTYGLIEYPYHVRMTEAFLKCFMSLYLEHYDLAMGNDIPIEFGL